MKKGSLLIFGLLFIIAIPVWVFWVTPQLTELPDDFAYRADIISLDNFYDEAEQQYSGEQRSVTTFSYEVTGQQQGNLVIKNVFDVRAVTGDKIFAVERLYGIDPKTGNHVAGFGDKTRDGFLFAPRNLKHGEPFTYWHTNYDGPAQMKFADEEMILGLKVYRYETNYEGVEIDQTDNLGFLPGVGITRGVRLDPYLQIWIEPVTGWLVKYKDQTDAYYYDLKTGERLHPWNKFGNTYERSSIGRQVALAKSQKLLFHSVQVTVPLFLVIVSFSMFFMGFHNRKIALVIFVIGTLGLAGYCASFFITTIEDGQIKIGISRWVPFGNQEYDRNIQGFKDALAQAGYREGEGVIYYLESAEANPEKQRAIIRSFVEKDVDLIYSLTTPGTLIIKEEVKDRPIIFSIVTYPVETGIIASLKNSNNNLVGTRNWIAIEDQVSIFQEIVSNFSRIGFLHRTGEPNSTIQLEQMRMVARDRGIEVIDIDAPNVLLLKDALQKSVGQFDVLYSACDTLIQGEAEEVVIEFAMSKKIPSFSCNASGPRKGDLIGAAADFYEIGKLAGQKAGLILEGYTPSSLTTDTVSRPYIYINQKTADNLGLTIPQGLFTRAEEIIR